MADLPNILDPGIRDAAFWANAANQAVRTYCGWHVAPVITETLRLDGSGTRKLLLPSNRVVDVTACTNDGVDVLAELDWSEKGIVEISGCWTRRLGGITITLQHGHDHASDVAGVIAGIAARAGSGAAGVAQQSVGPASVRYTGDSVPLLAAEKQALDPYRLQWSA